MHRALGRGFSTSVKRSLDFATPADVYRHKSFWEVLRGLVILKACSSDILVNNSLRILSVGQRVLGQRLFSALVKPTIYKQFVGGATLKEMQDCIAGFNVAGVRPMITCTMEEEDNHTAGANTVYDKNVTTILNCLDMSAQLNSVAPLMQLKMTSIIPADFLVRLSGIFRDSRSPERLVESSCNAMRGIPLQNEELLRMEKDDRENLQLALERLRQIGEKSTHVGVKMLVDAEYSTMTYGTNFLALTLMAAFNQSTPQIWNTYQCYLKAARQILEHDMLAARHLSLAFGVKLVRGAYMDGERDRAKALRYEDPVCLTYEATNANYNALLCTLLELVSDAGSKLNIIISTHNEESISIAVSKMQELNLDVDHPSVNFGQLLGMYDQITYHLAASGYNVYKSIPFGPVAQVLPYLARRASENRAVLQGPLKERQMLAEEVWRRLTFSKPFKQSHRL